MSHKNGCQDCHIHQNEEDGPTQLFSAGAPSS